MITREQQQGAEITLDIMHRLVTDGAAGEVVPPRTAEHPEYGTLVYVGATPAPHDALADCECGQPHVGYVVIRSDGMGSPLTFAGTVEEALINSMIMGIPPYDDAREVQPEDWPNA